MTSLRGERLQISWFSFRHSKLFPLQRVQKGSRECPASCSLDYGSFPKGKAARAWSRPFTFIQGLGFHGVHRDLAVPNEESSASSKQRRQNSRSLFQRSIATVVKNISVLLLRTSHVKSYDRPPYSRPTPRYLFLVTFFLILIAKQELSSTGVLPSGYATLYSKFQAELFLQPLLVPHRKDKNRNCFFGHIMNLIESCELPTPTMCHV